MTIVSRLAILSVAVGSLVSGHVSAQQIQHKTVGLEGWSVEVDTRLAEEGNELGQQTMRIVANQLYDLKLRLPADRVADLQTISIRIDYKHQLDSAQYHPSRRWLVSNGHDPELAKKVHIPRAQRFLRLYKTNQQPFVLLHELSHAYHDQFLNFDNEEIRTVYEQAISDGKYDRVLHVNGSKVEHYAKTNAKEFFAEMSECYLGTNDFYPFVKGELQQHDRLTFELLQKIWK
jgi:hypothetical protein